jgi:hypothetical protein
MRPAASGGTMARMPEPDQEKRIEVTVDPGSEPISGRVRRAGEPEREFHGWMGLASEIERARRGDAGESEPAV